jgi:pectinesterase
VGSSGGSTGTTGGSTGSSGGTASGGTASGGTASGGTASGGNHTSTDAGTVVDPETGPVLTHYSGPDCNDITDQKIITVASDGSGNHSKIGDAVGAASGATVIRIKPGTYKETMTISKSNVTLCGEKGKAKSTVITGANTGTSNGNVKITADDVSIENVTIENTKGYGTQAVALQIESNRVQFRNCRITGIQDTLYNIKGTHYFRDCYIVGRTDFIFGGATAVFENCEIFSEQCGSAILAPSTSGGTKYGIVILGGKATRNPTGAEMAPGCTHLARNWGAEGAATYINTWLADHIAPKGWAGMHSERVGEKARFGEYGTTGPGARPDARDDRMKVMTADDAAKFTIANIFGSWTPSFSK